MIDLPKPFAVVCHDAGAANIIIAWLEAMPSLEDIHVYLEGPAADLWTKIFPGVKLCSNLELVLFRSVALLSGTGWASDLEYNARKIAKERDIFSVAVLDHWVNYSERFYRHGIQLLPNELWVTDDYAKSIAEANFPNQIIRQLPNLYLMQQVEKISSLSDEAAELLYIAEPARDEWGRGVAGEFQALDFFLTQLPKLRLPADVVVRLRPHPSEEKDKYNLWMQEHPHLHFILDESIDLSAAISRAKWVVGCQSFALIIALVANRQVYCALPPWAPASRLPHDGITYLKDVC